MNLFRAMVAMIAAGFGRQPLGKQSWRKVQFRKYEVAPPGERIVRERLLRGMARTTGTTCLGC